MSSSSSSECDCENFCHNNDNVYGNRTPFFPTMGQPLIYYAQVPRSPSRRQKGRENTKDGRNCFVKAFKWYTQEHVPCSSPSGKPDVNGFAAWLDSKYDEFLQDGQLDSIYHLKVKRTSIIEADRTPNTNCCAPRAKRFRVKSPWRRKRYRDSKEGGDIIQKPVQSFQFILHPKELTRAASECFQQSDGTMQSTEMPITTKINSQSYSTLVQDKQKLESIDVKASHESKSENLVNSINFPYNINDSDKLKLQNASCQCSETVTIDAHSQYDDKYTERTALDDSQIVAKKLSQHCDKIIGIPPVPSKQDTDQGKVPVSTEPEIYVFGPTIANECQCYKNLNTKVEAGNENRTDAIGEQCEKRVVIQIPVKKETDDKTSVPKLLQCQFSKPPSTLITKVDAENQYETDGLECATNTKLLQTNTCPCESGLNEFKVINPVTFSSEAAQTSDHSIHLEKDAAHGYPLFVKIV